jgi:predicted flap endonuclease-1-like 5' DNA nuclease
VSKTTSWFFADAFIPFFTSFEENPIPFSVRSNDFSNTFSVVLKAKSLALVAIPNTFFVVVSIIVDIAEHKLDDAIEDLKKEAKKGTPKKKATKKTKATKTKTTKNVVKTAPKAKAKVTSKATAVDNLKLINGIGPKTETVFHNNGIKTFAALAKLEVPAIIAILEKEDIRFATIQVEIWQKQAEVAVKDGVEGIAKWIENYKTS